MLKLLSACSEPGLSSYLDLRPDIVDQFLAGLLLAQLRVGVGLIDDLLQARGAQHLLCERVQMSIRIRGDSRGDVALRYLLRIDQNRRGCLIFVGNQRHADNSGDGQQER